MSAFSQAINNDDTADDDDCNEMLMVVVVVVMLSECGANAKQTFDCL